MRDILFRGKIVDNGGWIYGSLITDVYEDYPRILSGAYISKKSKIKFSSFPVNNETISEYTGLWDKNGAKIFEGDIVKAVANGKTYTDEELIQHGISFVWYRESEKPEGTIYCKGEVVYIPEEGGWYIIKKTDGIENCRTSLGFVIKNPFEDCIVIGNIYDNPELLE